MAEAQVAALHTAKNSVVVRMAERFGVEPAKLYSTLKATAFRGDVSNEQFMALMIVADQYRLNPLTKEIYAFPDKNNGIVPVVGLDGWSRIVNEHSQYDGLEFVDGPANKDGVPEWIECVIHRKDREHPTKVREFYAECRRSTGPWGSHPRRMLRHKALIQCARLAFGFVGIYDQDEAERIIEGGVTRIDESPAIREINEAIAPATVATEDPEPPRLTYARLMDLFKAAHEARDVDLLDAHCTLIAELPEEQRADAITECKRIRVEITQ